MDVDLRRIAEDYVRLWDVSAPDGLAEDLFHPEVVDHNLQPGQGPGLAGRFSGPHTQLRRHCPLGRQGRCAMDGYRHSRGRSTWRSGDAPEGHPHRHRHSADRERPDRRAMGGRQWSGDDATDRAAIGHASNLSSAAPQNQPCLQGPRRSGTGRGIVIGRPPRWSAPRRGGR